MFLLIGIRYGGKEANREHPFGYGKAQFFYSFLVSVLLFGIAGWESAKHGYNAVIDPHPPGTGSATLPVIDVTFPAVYVNYSVLLGAIAFEAYALKKAYTAMSLQIERNEWSGLREAFRKTSDVTVLTALTEDTIAMAGAGIALMGVYLSRVTNNGIYDAVSALLIGLMLMGFAIALAWENKRLLLGESLPVEDERALREIVAGWEGVVEITDLRTVYFGPDRILVTADVVFDSALDTGEIDTRITDLEDALIAERDGIRKVYIEPEV